MVQPVLSDVLLRRKNRAIASVLSYLERECYPHLSQDVQKRTRTVILDEFNEFHDLLLDVMKSLDDGTYQVNEHYFTLLEEIHEALYGNRSRVPDQASSG